MGLSAAVACKEAGASLVVVGRDAESTELARPRLGDLTRFVVADAAHAETAERAAVEAVEQFGRLDALYHVAGGSERKFGDGPLHEVTDAGIDWTLALNLKSVIFSNRAAVRQFRAQGGGGAVLNMGSVLGFRPSPQFFSTHIYAAAKSAIVGFTRSCAASVQCCRGSSGRDADGAAGRQGRHSSKVREHEAAARWRSHRPSGRPGRGCTVPSRRRVEIHHRTSAVRGRRLVGQRRPDSVIRRRT
jgi:NADP-dependent 3-hydroxy acid dehydrogenase YdfG